MKILYVTSEMVPLASTGGLGDVSGSLPGALRRLGHDVRVIMPLYKTIKESYASQLQFVRWSIIRLGWRTMYSGLFQMEVNGVPLYLIDNDFYFGHDSLYIDYSFDIERFSFFQRAVLEALGEPMDFFPDLLHLNDWQSGMIPVLLESHYQKNGYFTDLRTLLTIHNLKHQGIHGRENVMDLFDLSDDYMTEDKVLKDGSPNFLKAGIVFANRVSTVSPTYAKEITTAYFGEGLDQLLLSFGWKLTGILNGIDTELYDPETDPELVSSYSLKSWMKGKAACKKALQQECHLPKEPKIPLLSMVTRLDSQKGLDLLLHILDELLEEDVQFVLLGTGDPAYEKALSEIESRHPGKMRALITYDRLLSRRIYAGSDLFLMPSLFEPCGLSQMIAMRYGTLPLVRQTGGLADTVEAYNKYEKTGTGFGFLNINAHELLYTAKEAVELYREDREAWSNMVQQAMSGDYSWTRSAKTYETLYEAILEER
ncbi:MAG: glycogen synthase GlgA [Eubacteriales bacterium]|nr:glycogen synthase GlgA [Eubacteriales bacterium]MDD3540442.1 glycogen synthase GlgA [Eubacteriales bacterium]